MAPQGLVLSFDLGTTTLKSAVFDARGQVVLHHAVPVDTRRGPDGLAEQDPGLWLRFVASVQARVAAEGLAAQIGCVGITSQVNTHVFADAAGHALAPAILWQDTRCAAAAARLDARIAAGQRLAWWGAPLPVDASHALARAAWMAETNPGLWARTATILSPKDFVLQAICGARVSDPMASIGLVGPDLAYLPDLVALVPGVAARLPPLAPATAVAGHLALAPGLPPVPVAVGTMDAWAGMEGLGMRAEGDALWLSGTSEVLGIVSDTANPVPGVLVFPQLGGIRLHAGPTQSGGASVAWFCNLFGITPDEMAAMAGSVPDDGLPLFLPHLAGERAPLWDAGAQGAFLGLTATTGRAELARSVFQGVAFSARLLLETLEASAGRRAGVISCGGGGFRAAEWNRLRADVLGRPLQRVAVPDPGLLGAAAAALVAAGQVPDIAAALAQVVRHDPEIAPDPARHATHSAAYARYLPAYRALAGLRGLP